MSEPFEIAREFEVEAPPEDVFAAVTTGTAGWLFPLEYEPREGGAASGGATVTVWDPPHRVTALSETPGGEYGQLRNQLDHLVEPRGQGGSWVRYVHSGIFVDDWGDQYDGANRHTDFYLHTLRQYLTYFRGRPAVFSAADGPAAAGAPDALERAARALGLPPGAAPDTEVEADLPGAGPTAAVLDYRSPYFIGLRTADAMYRFFGRNHWGATVGVAVHAFAPGADAAKATAEAADWLARAYA
ncbi:SRPBCC domain-containing protein [Streptomyces sp. NPDC021020]|uniref:SRPBCC domain-containing protein n=1 Tax=Streptomyces sp. NPDC021020 TaxID=3365109 RepID=UPI0037B6BA02